MARVRGRNGIYVTDRARLSSVANGRKVYRLCDEIGQGIAAAASEKSGKQYKVDTRMGRFRIHTRVSTLPDKRSFWREHHHHELADVHPRMPAI